MEMIDYALGYLGIGWAPIPLKRNKRPYIDWEKYQGELPTVDDVKGWWGKYPQANIGIVTGTVSGLLVVDVESNEGFNALFHTVGEVPETVVQHTGKPNGKHLLFNHPRDRDYPNWAKRIHDVDFRGDGGYIMVAPSVHPNGTVYAWNGVNPLEDGLDDLLDLGDDLHKFLLSQIVDTASENSITKNPDGWVQEMMLYGVEQGNRNESLTKLAGYYFGSNPDWKEAEVFNAVQLFNVEKCRPSLPRNEIVALVKSIGRRHQANKVADDEVIANGVLEQQLYPDGSSTYHFYLSHRPNDYIELTPSDLLSVRAFKVKMMERTGVVIRHKKQVEWDSYIASLLENRQTRTRGLDEAVIGKIVESLESEVQSARVSNDYIQIKRRACIVKDGIVKIAIAGLENHLARVNVLNISRKELSGYLRRLGFCPQRTSFTDGGVKTDLKIWALHADLFNENVRKMQQGSDITTEEFGDGIEN